MLLFVCLFVCWPMFDKSSLLLQEGQTSKLFRISKWQNTFLHLYIQINGSLLRHFAGEGFCLQSTLNRITGQNAYLSASRKTYSQLFNVHFFHIHI